MIFLIWSKPVVSASRNPTVDGNHSVVCGGGRWLRWGWVFRERTRILSGIQFTRHLIEFVVVEPRRFVGSNLNAILTVTRQTCGQHSSMSTGRKL